MNNVCAADQKKKDNEEDAKSKSRLKKINAQLYKS